MNIILIILVATLIWKNYIVKFIIYFTFSNLFYNASFFRVANIYIYIYIVIWLSLKKNVIIFLIKLAVWHKIKNDSFFFSS